MAVGILLITHEGIGSALLAVTRRLVSPLPLRVEAFEVPFDADADALLPQASAALRRVDGGVGVLVLTDLYGASPSNLAATPVSSSRIDLTWTDNATGEQGWFQAQWAVYDREGKPCKFLRGRTEAKRRSSWRKRML